MAYSREGIPFSSYRWTSVVLSIPFAVLFGFFLFLWRVTICKKIPNINSVPENAIICFFHTELFIGMLMMSLYSKFSKKGGWILGTHTFLSYLWCAESYLRGWHVWRFDPRNEGVREGLKTLLARSDVKTFRYATDSGGPYGVIRKSILDLSQNSNRPVVINRLRCSRSFTVAGHVLPLPFSSIEAFFSAPISAEKLSSLPPEQALNLLQKTAEEM